MKSEEVYKRTVRLNLKKQHDWIYQYQVQLFTLNPSTVNNQIALIYRF